MSDKEKYLFCSAKIRPSFCKQSTNLCCIRCDLNIECRKLSPSKVKPCTVKECEDSEICEFMI
ncbi:hypothetical protein GW796_05810 [archaeon]|nr:hypothetical protein [archaeon]NCQ51400.1 hypothetical protein [archaeon]NCT58774.1 hypothetical protein [archaeon]